MTTSRIEAPHSYTQTAAQQAVEAADQVEAQAPEEAAVKADGRDSLGVGIGDERARTWARRSRPMRSAKRDAGALVSPGNSAAASDRSKPRARSLRPGRQHRQRRRRELNIDHRQLLPLREGPEFHRRRKPSVAVAAPRGVDAADSAAVAVELSLGEIGSANQTDRRGRARRQWTPERASGLSPDERTGFSPAAVRGRRRDV